MDSLARCTVLSLPGRLCSPSLFLITQSCSCDIHSSPTGLGWRSGAHSDLSCSCVTSFWWNDSLDTFSYFWCSGDRSPSESQIPHVSLSVVSRTSTVKKEKKKAKFSGSFSPPFLNTFASSFPGICRHLWPPKVSPLCFQYYHVLGSNLGNSVVINFKLLSYAKHLGGTDPMSIVLLGNIVSLCCR